MKGPKRVLAFGGSYYIFREGVKPENLEVLANNLAKFINDHGLDGIDLDWEYPAAPDIPGIPSADRIDGKNYLEFLKLLCNKLPTSFWCLKPFPIAEIAKTVDYIVYMTYDLHGQWDYSSQWANVGYPNGNCLRSHVNLTETLNSLSMVTKAGVPSNKLIIGISSYGRSFRMTDPSCTGPHCTFVGPSSAATKGECTGTPDYIYNAEIDKIIENGAGETSFDRFADSDILVYGSDWAAYMSETTKARRTSLYKSYNFGGTTEWAVDLAKFIPNSGGGSNVPALPQEGEEWMGIDCSHKLARDETANPIQRWNQLKCKDAWDSAIHAWKNRAPGGTDRFVVYVSSYLKGPPDMVWQINAEENEFYNTVECSNEQGKTPVGVLILRSFTKLSKGFYKGVESAGNTFDLTMEDFADTFAPAQEADGSTSDYMLFSVQVWEVAMAGVDMGMTAAAKATEESTVLEPITKDLGVALSAITVNWKRLVSKTVTDTFLGTDESIAYLTTMINENKLLHTEIQAAVDIERSALRALCALYAYIIPMREQQKPFPVESRGPFNQMRALGQQGSTMRRTPHVAVNGYEGLGESGELGQEKWGGITRSDIIKSTLTCYAIKQNRDLDRPADVANPGGREQLRQQIKGGDIVSLPGVIQIPKCGQKEIAQNWRE
ncbi:glycoside hydrolase family 18 protein [Bipolaris sorokiniana ND90Pr]|uniref:chitinase n=1 Tax=Cochliobolus sativus (strain ND90Pr / ATCC 201652) TaxID=665912 RepID=M2T5M4_COCSN|nr:glycoside hydrolase family 18 protein [Bipolaris sorokiniana ND90Pr]EMD69740.1 glycoside hydrolase family 18 protein [Bipolaris sorokiniana ND90Pr]